jgi:spore coat polysaccharide biosynthesis predicted glycosyltransferase SpsG
LDLPHRLILLCEPRKAIARLARRTQAQITAGGQHKYEQMILRVNQSREAI